MSLDEILVVVERRSEELSKTSLRYEQSLIESYEGIDGVLKSINECSKEIKYIENTLNNNSAPPLITNNSSSSSTSSTSISSVPASPSKLNPEEVRERVDKIKSNFRSITLRHAPKTGSLFVRLMLGKVNVRSFRDGERLTRKNEYEKFRSRTNIGFLVLVLLRLLVWWRAEQVPALVVDLLETIWLSWLVYYYTTLALRENILKVNGSNIRAWWLIHHYLSMLLSVIMLVWPRPTPAYDRFREIAFPLTVFQAITQILITRYQIGQLYRKVAMGRASRFDVSGEAEASFATEPSFFTPSAAVLLPFLLATQVTQVLVGLGTANLIVEYRDTVTWHAYACCVVCSVIGCGNLFTTLKTYISKFNAKKKAQ